MEIKALALSLDGTVLMHKRQELSPRIAHALRVAARHGICIIVVTSRIYENLPKSITNNIWSKCAITINGAEIRDISQEGLLLRSHYFPAAQMQAFLELVSCEKLPYVITAEGKLCVNPQTAALLSSVPVISKYTQYLSQHQCLFSDELSSFLQTHTLSALTLPYIPPELYTVIQDKIADSHLSASWLGQGHVELTHSDANRGTALRDVCELMHIPLQQTVAIGYTDADAPMLEIAGVGVALGNASAQVRLAGDALIDTLGDEGAAEAIEQYVLTQTLRGG